MRARRGQSSGLYPCHRRAQGRGAPHGGPSGGADVAECTAIGVTDALKGRTPPGFLCLNRGSPRDAAQVVRECVALMREKIGPVAGFKRALVVNRLPKARSGTILRATMARIADGEPWKMPATIDDPAIPDEIRTALQSPGCAGT